MTVLLPVKFFNFIIYNKRRRRDYRLTGPIYLHSVRSSHSCLQSCEKHLRRSQDGYAVGRLTRPDGDGQGEYSRDSYLYECIIFFIIIIWFCLGRRLSPTLHRALTHLHRREDVTAAAHPPPRRKQWTVPTVNTHAVRTYSYI